VVGLEESMSQPVDGSLLEEVDYQSHYDIHAAPYCNSPNAETVRYFEARAQEVHIYAVETAVQKLMVQGILMLSEVALNEEAQRHLRFGVLRRLNMLQASFRNFRNCIMPGRTEPLSLEESNDVCRDLNAIYINLVGILDNYAWFLMHQKGLPETQNVAPQAIGLFKKAFRNDANLSSVAREISQFAGWEEDLVRLRHPAAHRMPLYVPSTVLTSEEAKSFEHYGRLISEAVSQGQFDRLPELHNMRRHVGTLVPQFLHDPREGTNLIYPTIPQDIGTMVKIGRIAEAFVRG
jgi:hypothetical protein